MRILIIGLALALTACTTTGPKQTGGAIIGGAAGAVAGSQFGSGSGRLAATALGTLLGAGLGAEAGASLDRADQTYRYGPVAPVPQQVPQMPQVSPGIGIPQAPSSYAGPPLNASCRELTGGFKRAFACQNRAGRWYVVQ